jgi:hypothetical protein
MTAGQSPYRQPCAPRGPVQLHRLHRVRAARRVEPAARAQQRADELPVARQHHQQRPRRRRAPPTNTGRLALHRQHRRTSLHAIPSQHRPSQLRPGRYHCLPWHPLVSRGRGLPRSPRLACGHRLIRRRGTVRPHGHPLAFPCRRSKAPITRSRSAARSAWQAVGARGPARNTSRLPPGSMHRYPRARCRSRRRTRFRTTAGPTARLTTNPTSACRSEPGSTSRLPDSSGRPALLPCLLAASKSARRRIRAAAGSMSMRWRSRPQTLTRARPFRRLAARTARPARVRMRSRKPCVFARRRLFGWNVRLLTRTPVGGRSWCSGQCAQDKRGWDASCPYSGRA